MAKRTRIALFLVMALIAASCGGSSGTDTAEAVNVSDAGAEATAPKPEDPSAPETPEATTAPQQTATSTPDATTAPVGADAGSTAAAVEAGLWSDNVVITVNDNGTFRYESDGLPSHELPDQFLVPNLDTMPPFEGDDIEGSFNIANTDGLIVASPLDVEITTLPVYSEEITLTSLSTIGVMVSGAPLFNDYEDQSREFVAIDDNLSLDGVYFIDACNGHPLATGDSYHYHGIPYCITDNVDAAGEHSTMIGVLLDGFPIYGPQDENGVELTNDDLDDCSGHVGATPEFPEGIYHYHLTEDGAPYSIDCFHGEIDYGGAAGGGGGGDRPEGGGGGAPEGDDESAQGGGPGGPPDLTDAAVTLGVSEEDLTAALGERPYDFEAAAAALGVDVADLQAALPTPPDRGERPEGGGGRGERPEGDAPADGQDESADVAVDPAVLAANSEVALNAQWGDNVTITIEGATLIFQSNGLPSHEYLDVYLGDGRDGKFIAGGVDAYDAYFEIPVVPLLAVTPTETPGGAIGVAISGAVFFDPYEGDGSGTIANDDNETIDGIPFIDACGGHPLPNGVSYHYHGIPFCITDAIDTAGEHSALIGYLFDGYPIYGPQDVDGSVPDDLDACLGHVGETPDHEGETYHYHVIPTANYISECFTGVS